MYGVETKTISLDLITRNKIKFKILKKFKGALVRDQYQQLIIILKINEYSKYILIIILVMHYRHKMIYFHGDSDNHLCCVILNKRTKKFPIK